MAWAAEEFGDAACVLASMQDAVLIDIASRVAPELDIVFLDTGFHFPETWWTLRAIERRYRIQVTVIRHAKPRPTEPFEPGACCADKTELLDAALSHRRAWLTGIRRTDTAHRSSIPIVGTDRRSLVKISPLAQWNDDDVHRYRTMHEVIRNPLLDHGYGSIGCATCTSPLPADAADTRSGRWLGQSKTECGLHL